MDILEEACNTKGKKSATQFNQQLILLLIKVHLLECTLSLLSLVFVSGGQSTAPLGQMLLHYK